MLCAVIEAIVFGIEIFVVEAALVIVVFGGLALLWLALDWMFDS